MTGWTLAGLLFLAGARPLAAQPSVPPAALPPEKSAGVPKPFAVSGYVKNLWQYSRSAIDRRPYFINVARERVSLEAARSILRARVDYDHEQLAGSFFRTREYQGFNLAETPGLLDAEHRISTGDTAIWRHRLYRWWAGVETGSLVARFGRQRIAWGTGKLFNPTDILNPVAPIAVEPEERPGVDALYLRQSLGDLSQAELAWAPERRWRDNALLARARTNLLGFDLSLMGGKTSLSTASWIVGGDFAGNLADGTFRGEWAYADPDEVRPFWRACVGYDYTFPAETRLPGFKDLAVMAEYYHNGAGTTSVFNYDPAKALSGRELALAKDYAGMSFSKELHPLVKLDTLLMVNLDDGSWFAGPVLAWDAGHGLNLSGGFHRYGGSRVTEFGALANRGFLQAQWFY